jgi:uncharacterized membrane protein
VVPPVHFAFGCTQLPETALKVVPLTAKPDQFVLMSEVAARAVTANPAEAVAMTAAVRARRFLICLEVGAGA